MAKIIDDLLKTFDKGAKVVTTRSTSFIETNKLKNELNGLKKSRNESLAEIGKKVVDLKADFSLDAVEDQVKSIETIDTAIQVKEAEISRIKEETNEKINNINSGISKVKEEEVANATQVDIEVGDLDADFDSDFQVRQDGEKENLPGEGEEVIEEKEKNNSEEV